MFSILSLQVIAEAQGMTGKYRRGGYVKKRRWVFRSCKKKRGRGLGISAIFIKKYKNQPEAGFWRG
ncbi:hypothetical protein IE987_29630 [Klebsiella pneumoniae]|uniref:Uncharacterized protein n=1 Tax=Klebsiella pneumoniae TaxID=573 RepID=A0A927DLG3_KLEPN|nr:hypothetical protein [Klebsiella pneumoniae]